MKFVRVSFVCVCDAVKKACEPDCVPYLRAQFHKWHAELEAAYASEMEEKYKRYADLLNSHRESCEEILGKVGRSGKAIVHLVSGSSWARLGGGQARISCP